MATYKQKLVGCERIDKAAFQIAIQGPLCCPRIWGTSNEQQARRVLASLEEVTTDAPFAEVIKAYCMDIEELTK